MSLTASATRSPSDSFVAVAWSPYAVSATLPPFLALGSSLPHDAMWHSPGVPLGSNGNYLNGTENAKQAAPLLGRRLKHVRYGLPSVHLHCRTGHLTSAAPAALSPSGAPASAASRGWSRVGARLPCQDQWSVTYFYDGSAGMGRPSRDQFVIFIEPGVHMSG